MRIGELSQKAGLSKDTIRFYEKLGLIHVRVEYSGHRNFKSYDNETLERLSLIKQAKMLGFTLKQIKQGVDAWQNDTVSQTEKIQIMQRQIEQVDSKINELCEIRGHLVNKLERLL